MEEAENHVAQEKDDINELINRLNDYGSKLKENTDDIKTQHNLILDHATSLREVSDKLDELNDQFISYTIKNDKVISEILNVKDDGSFGPSEDDNVDSTNGKIMELTESINDLKMQFINFSSTKKMNEFDEDSIYGGFNDDSSSFEGKIGKFKDINDRISSIEDALVHKIDIDVFESLKRETEKVINTDNSSSLTQKQFENMLEKSVFFNNLCKDVNNLSDSIKINIDNSDSKQIKNIKNENSSIFISLIQSKVKMLEETLSDVQIKTNDLEVKCNNLSSEIGDTRSTIEGSTYQREFKLHRSDSEQHLKEMETMRNEIISLKKKLEAIDKLSSRVSNVERSVESRCSIQSQDQFLLSSYQQRDINLINERLSRLENARSEQTVQQSCIFSSYPCSEDVHAQLREIKTQLSSVFDRVEKLQLGQKDFRVLQLDFDTVKNSLNESSREIQTKVRLSEEDRHKWMNEVSEQINSYVDTISKCNDEVRAVKQKLESVAKKQDQSDGTLHDKFNQFNSQLQQLRRDFDDFINNDFQDVKVHSASPRRRVSFVSNGDVEDRLQNVENCIEKILAKNNELPISDDSSSRNVFDEPCSACNIYSTNERLNSIEDKLIQHENLCKKHVLIEQRISNLETSNSRINTIENKMKEILFRVNGNDSSSMMTQKLANLDSKLNLVNKQLLEEIQKFYTSSQRDLLNQKVDLLESRISDIDARLLGNVSSDKVSVKNNNVSLDKTGQLENCTSESPVAVDSREFVAENNSVSRYGAYDISVDLLRSENEATNQKLLLLEVKLADLSNKMSEMNKFVSDIVHNQTSKFGSDISLQKVSILDSKIDSCINTLKEEIQIYYQKLNLIESKVNDYFYSLSDELSDSGRKMIVLESKISDLSLLIPDINNTLHSQTLNMNNLESVLGKVNMLEIKLSKMDSNDAHSTKNSRPLSYMDDENLKHRLDSLDQRVNSIDTMRSNQFKQALNEIIDLRDSLNDTTKLNSGERLELQRLGLQVRKLSEDIDKNNSEIQSLSLSVLSSRADMTYIDRINMLESHTKSKFDIVKKAFNEVNKRLDIVEGKRK